MSRVRRLFVMTLAALFTIAFSSGVIFGATEMKSTEKGWKSNVTVKNTSTTVKVDGGTWNAKVVKVKADSDGLATVKVTHTKGTNDSVSFVTGTDSKEFKASKGVKGIAKKKTATYKMNVTKGKTYYVAVYQSCSDKEYADKATVEFTIAPLTVEKLSTKNVVTVKPDKNFDYYVFKFKAKESGVAGIDIKMAVASDGPKDKTKIGKMMIYQKDGKGKSAYRKVKYGTTVNFGVKKGKTYYLRFKPGKKYYKALNVKLTNTNYPVGKTKKEKAKTLKAGKGNNSYSTYVIAGKKCTHWYKVEVVSGSHMFALGRDMASDVTMKVYKGKEDLKMINGIKEYLPSGTYYVKIQSKDKKASGGYNLTYI